MFGDPRKSPVLRGLVLRSVSGNLGWQLGQIQGHLGAVTSTLQGSGECASFLYPSLGGGHLPGLLPANPGQKMNRWLGHGSSWRISQAGVGRQLWEHREELGETREDVLEKVTAE